MLQQKVRIKLTSTDIEKLDKVCQEIKAIAKQKGVKMSGPIPLPRKRLVLPVRKTPCGEGTKTWRKHELRIYRRLIDISVTDPSIMRQIIRVNIPEDVSIEMTVT